MNYWFFLILSLMIALSWLLLVTIQKRVRHVTDSHINIFGDEHRELFKNKRFFVLRIVYFLVMLGLTFFCLALFYFFMI